MPSQIKDRRRFPELRLPHFERDDIRKSLDAAMSDVKLPDVDLTKIEMPDIDLPTGKEVRRAIEDAAIRVGVRDKRQSPFRIVAALAIIGALIAFVASRPTVRVQLERSAQKARERIDEMRREREARDIDIEATDIAVPIAPGAWTDDEVTATFEVAPDSPADIDRSASAGDGIPAFEESESTNPV
jgi:hypothetical protein